MSSAFYESLFGAAERAGVHHLPHGPIDDLQTGAIAAGCLVVRIDLFGVRNKDELLTAVGKALRFPEWFGHNWDALTDCLTDMGWLPATGYVIILDRCDGIHARSESDFVTCLQIFQDSADVWREDDVPFWCLVDMQDDGIAWLPTMAQQ
jgi:hypothetical protein